MTDEARLRDEIAELRADNDRLSAQLGRPSWGRRGRVAAHWLALVLGGVLVLLTVLAVWTRNQVVDTDRYVRTVAPLATQPSIQRLVTDKLTAAVADPQRTAAFARDVLPPRAAPLASPIAGGLERFVRDRIDGFVRSPDFARLWDGVSRRTHESAVALLTGAERGRLQIAGRDGMRLVLAVGLVVALGAAVAGPARPAVALRDAVRGLGTIAGGGVLALVLQDQPTGRSVLTIAVVCLVLVALVQLVAAGARPAPAVPSGGAATSSPAASR